MVFANSNLSYYFSEEDVKEVLQLAGSNQQRLCNVSETGETEYYFLVPETNHFAEVKVSVSATRSPLGRHVSYEVFASYQGCCKVAEETSTDEHFRRQIQLVYNIRIQVVRLRFDAAWYVCAQSPRIDELLMRSAARSNLTQMMIPCLARRRSTGAGNV